MELSKVLNVWISSHFVPWVIAAVFWGNMESINFTGGQKQNFNLQYPLINQGFQITKSLQGDGKEMKFF